MGATTTTYVTDYPGLISLPVGSVALCHTTGTLYRVAQFAGPGRTAVRGVYTHSPNGGTSVLHATAGLAGGRPFATALAVVYRPSA